MKHRLGALLTAALVAVSCCGLVACGKETAAPRDWMFKRATVEKVAGKKKDWNDVSSFICYYGAFDPLQQNFDVAIMHANTLFGYADPEDAKAEVKKLSDAGTYTIAYISVGEDDALHTADGLGEGGYASYYVYENGAPKVNPNWGSYFVDASSPVWQAKILDRAAEILSFGVDGLFLDTLDTVDVRPESLGGLVELVKKLDETFPDAKIVANRGFNLLKYISPYIDGLMFESFNTTWDFTLNMAVDLTDAAREYNDYAACNIINAVRMYDYFPVFCLDYCNDYEYTYMPQSYYDHDWEYDFIPYVTSDILLGTPMDPGVTPKSNRGVRALETYGDTGMSDNNADMTEANFAYAENGTKVTVSSTFPGYSKTALNDGWYATPENHNQNNWAKEAWASIDSMTQDHWIEFDFGGPRSVGKVVVHWANDNGTYYSPQLAKVQAWVGDEWVDVAEWTNATEVPDEFVAFAEKTEFTFGAVSTSRIRVLQPKGKGACDRFGDAVRAGIMWVSEVEIFAA